MGKGQTTHRPNESMKYRNEKNKIQALKSGSTAALRGIILEGCQNLYVYAAAICGEYHQEMVLMTEIYLEMWETRDRLDPEEQLDLALKRIMWKLVYIHYRGGKYRLCIDTEESSLSRRDGYGSYALSEWLTGLKPFDKKMVISSAHRWRCPPGFKAALVRNVMRRIPA